MKTIESFEIAMDYLHSFAYRWMCIFVKTHILKLDWKLQEVSENLSRGGKSVTFLLQLCQ